jgi:hypothetical protein
LMGTRQRVDTMRLGPDRFTLASSLLGFSAFLWRTDLN